MDWQGINHRPYVLDHHNSNEKRSYLSPIVIECLPQYDGMTLKTCLMVRSVTNQQWKVGLLVASHEHLIVPSLRDTLNKRTKYKNRNALLRMINCPCSTNHSLSTFSIVEEGASQRSP